MSSRVKISIAAFLGASVVGLFSLLVFPPGSRQYRAARIDPPTSPGAAVEPEATGAERPAAAEAGPLRGRDAMGSPASPESTAPDLPVNGWVIAGRIVWETQTEGDEADGSRELSTVPVEGATVYVKPHPRKTKPSDAPPVQDRLTGPDGRFEFAGVPGNVWLRIEIDEPSSAYRTLSFRFGDPSGDGRKDLGDLRVEPGGTLAVKLIGPWAEPVEGGTVLVNKASADPNLSNSGLSESRREAAEQGKGLYVLDRAPLGSLQVQARAPGYSPSEAATAELPQEKPLVIRLGAGSVIAGWVLSPGDRAIEGAEVEASGGSDPFTAKIDSAGRFIFDGLGEGEYSVSVSAEGFISAQATVKTGTEDLEFLLPPEAVFAGTVVSDDDERPVVKARVTLRIPDPDGLAFSAETGFRGSFAVRKVPEGTYAVIADHADFAPAFLEPRELKAGEKADGGTIRLWRGFAATGTVIDSKTGAPIQGAKVSFGLRGEREDVLVERTARTDSEGAFEVKGLCEGSYILAAEAAGHLRKEEQVDLTRDGERDFSLALDEGNEIQIGGQGWVLEGLTFQLDDSDGATVQVPAENMLILGGEGKTVKIRLFQQGDPPQPGAQGGGAEVEVESPGADRQEVDDRQQEPAREDDAAKESR